MKKTIAIILFSLILLSTFTSCNLDNEGILYRGPDRTVSDNKNRHFIGEIDNDFYFVSNDGLEKGLISVEGSKHACATSVLSGDGIFENYHPDLSWIDGSSIVYMDDTAGKQEFYSISTADGAKTPLTCAVPAGEIAVSTFSDGTENYIVTRSSSTNGSNKGGAVYSAVLADTTLTLTPKYDAVDNYLSCINGLISYISYDSEGNASYNHRYLDKVLTFSLESNDKMGNEIKSFYRSGDDLYAIRNKSNTLTIFKGAVADGSMTAVASISGSYNRQFPSLVDQDKLYFLVWNGSSTASRFYSIDLTLDYSQSENTISPSTTSNGIEAEAFFEYGGTIYMLSKDHGLFYVDVDRLARV